MSSIYAANDALLIVEALERDGGGAMEAEIHAFAYLACLLAVYDGRSPAWWEYRFTATRSGAPYAHVLADTTDELLAAGAVVVGERGLVLSARGRSERELLGALSLSVRTRYLEAATATALMLPLPSVPAALTLEPQLRSALAWTSARELLEPEGLRLVHEQFEAISVALETDRDVLREDLMVPAVVWLAYLLEADERAEQAA